jgi:hypothetical protein
MQVSQPLQPNPQDNMGWLAIILGGFLPGRTGGHGGGLS